MKITTKLKKIGTSMFVLIPSNLCNIMELNEGDILEADLIKTNESILKEYRCLICEHTFTSSDNEEDVYCPNCGEESNANIKELK